MAKIKQAKQGFVSNAEFITYLAMAFFLTNLQGMVNSYRQAYLVDVLGMQKEYISIINLVTAIVPLVLSFFFAMVVDRAPKPGKPKFKPIIMTAAIPMGILALLMFFTPPGLREMSAGIMIAYQCFVTIAYKASEFFAGTTNHIQTVITSDPKERDKVISFRSISSAIGNSAPLVVVLVIGLLVPHEDATGTARMYMISVALCAVVSTVTLLLGARVVKERVTYSPTRVNPLLGFRDVLKNKYALLLMISEFLKGFRGIASYMGVFLAVALLGDSSKFILLGLPTGIGTMVGMLIVNALLKKFNSKQIYIGSGIYSVLANACAFAAGLAAFRHEGQALYQIVFFAFLFLIGLQYGASNLLPSMFKADVLEDLEANTHKRLEASLDFAVSIGGSASGAIAQALGPIVLLSASLIGYVQKVEGIYLPQTAATKDRLLAVYTLAQGAFMLLGALPFILYKLTGARKEKVHQQVLDYRASLLAELQESDAQAEDE